MSAARKGKPMSYT